MQADAKQAKSNPERTPRKSVRKRSSLEVMVRVFGMMVPGRLYDISLNGAAIDLGQPFPGATGSAIRLESTAFVFVDGKVRWHRDSRIGIEFDPSSNAVAKIHSYFKYSHKDPVVDTKK